MMTTTGQPVGVAVVGCGTISDEYLRNLTSFRDLRVLICALQLSLLQLPHGVVTGSRGEGHVGQ